MEVIIIFISKSERSDVVSSCSCVCVFVAWIGVVIGSIGDDGIEGPS